MTNDAFTVFSEHGPGRVIDRFCFEMCQFIKTMASEGSWLMARKKKSLDDVFEEIVGPAGRAQWVALIAFLPIQICGVFPLSILLGLFVPQHRCFIQGCDDGSNASSQTLDWRIANVSIPIGSLRLLTISLQIKSSYIVLF